MATCVDNSFVLISLSLMIWQVGNRDTLTSVAARFDTTPGELTSLNKLNSSFIYPGQSLLVPDKTASSGENISEVGSDITAQGSPTEKTRKLSTEEVQQEEKERGKPKQIDLFISAISWIERAIVGGIIKCTHTQYLVRLKRHNSLSIHVTHFICDKLLFRRLCAGWFIVVNNG